MNAELIERQRIRDYARGWNDAMLGKPDTNERSLAYALGYMDATR